MRTAIRASSSIFFLIALAPVGCGSKSAPTEKVEIAKTAGGGTSIVTQSPDGSQLHVSVGGDNMTVPAEFPKEFAFYPGSKITAVTKSPGTLMVVGQTADSLDKVDAFCQDQIQKSGWTAGESMKMGGDGGPPAMMRQIEKGKQKGTLIIAREGDVTNIHWTIVSSND